MLPLSFFWTMSITDLEPIAGRCRMTWAVFQALPAVRAAAPTAEDRHSLKRHLRKVGLLSTGAPELVAIGSLSPIPSWQASERAALIPPRIRPARQRRSGNYPAVGDRPMRFRDPLTGELWP